MFLEHFCLSHPEDLPLREKQICYRMKISADLRSNFQVFVDQELHRNMGNYFQLFKNLDIWVLLGRKNLLLPEGILCLEKQIRNSSPSLYFSFIFLSSLLQRCRSGLNYLLDFPCTSQTSGSLAGLRDYLNIKPEYQRFCVLAKNSVCEQKAGGTCSLGFSSVSYISLGTC